MENSDASAMILAMLRGQLRAGLEALAREVMHLEHERAALGAQPERRHLGPERRGARAPAHVAPGHGRAAVPAGGE